MFEELVNVRMYSGFLWLVAGGLSTISLTLIWSGILLFRKRDISEKELNEYAMGFIVIGIVQLILAIIFWSVAFSARIIG